MNDSASKRQLSGLGPMVTTKRRRTGPQSPVATIQEPSPATSPSDCHQEDVVEIAQRVSPDDNGIHAAKPEACGKPPAFADKRAQMADALPFNKNHEGCLYTSDKTLKGMVIDGEASSHDVITDSIIVTAIGGGREFDAATGRMLRTKSQDENDRKHEWVNNAFKKKCPVSVIIGSKNPSYPVKPPRTFCLMGFFQVTYIWAEKTEAADGSLVSEYMVRLEKIDSTKESWWMPAGYESAIIPVGEYECGGKSCAVCGKYSKTIYTEGWTCLQMSCEGHFEFGRSVNPDEMVYNVKPDELVYTEAFLLERHSAHDFLPLPQDIPELPEPNTESHGSETEFKRGIVCRCGFCSRRVHWWGWKCENTSEKCGFRHRVEFVNYPLAKVEGECAGLSSYDQAGRIDTSILRTKISSGGYSIDMYAFPNSEGLIGGVASVFRATPETCGLLNGPDELYFAMQNEKLRLRRNPARAKGSRREELTSHFAFNYGAFYKFGVFVDSVGFKQAPGTILKCLAQLDWAQSLGITHLPDFIDELPMNYSAKSMSLKSEKFNELLALGYFEGSKISYHDDGEKELGPTVATLSLGSPAVMRFRPKRKSALGEAGTGQKPHVLSFVLKHGDIVIMHGTDIHRDYEHEVTPKGKLRFALTARYVRPELIKNPTERAQAIANGEVPDGIEMLAYKGHEEATEAVSNTPASP